MHISQKNDAPVFIQKNEKLTNKEVAFSAMF